MTTSSECDKITFVLSEDKTYFTIIYEEVFSWKKT